MALGLAAVAVGMVGAAYAAVPLYPLFCQVTGYGGTPGVAAGAPLTVGERVIGVRFNADTQSQLPWRFRPAQGEIAVRVGESALAFYRAENLSEEPLVGTATYNVTPLKAGAYFTKIDCFCFTKIDCFCFTEQFLGPRASADLPVTFYIDPAIEDDRNMDDVHTITLSYMFFNAGAEARERYLSAGAGERD